MVWLRQNVWHGFTGATSIGPWEALGATPCILARFAPSARCDGITGEGAQLMQHTHTQTFGLPLFPFNLSAILLQFLVREFVERVGPGGADDDAGLVLLLDDGLGGGHQLPLKQKKRKLSHRLGYRTLGALGGNGKRLTLMKQRPCRV